MALSALTKRCLKKGLANRAAGTEVILAIEGFPDAASVATDVTAIGGLATVGAAVGALDPVGTGAVDSACALASDVDTNFTTLQAAHDAAIALVDARVTTLQAKVDELIAALKVADLMAAV